MSNNNDEDNEINFTYADAAKPLSPTDDFGDDEKGPLLGNEVKYLGSYANAVQIPNGHSPPAYEKIDPQSHVIPPRPFTPPSTTLISIYSEPIRVEYEENERIHRAGCCSLLWNYYACCGMTWTLFAILCCLLPIWSLLIIYFFI